MVCDIVLFVSTDPNARGRWELHGATPPMVGHLAITTTLRTTHITEHIARRTDIKTVQGNAGHASLATTNFYARYVKEAQIRAMQENAP